ncbi:MAG: adenylate/guanylate cyclase domain-containing protein [Pseudomonadota bacterium]|nr:adenylate/guanylate cyclase domain-containing protein [Pseudomonadota bacterium]
MPLPERRLAAISYAEMRNFTRLSEALQPEKVLQLANEFFTLAASCATKSSGKVMCLHNDSLLAAFAGGAPAELCGRALHAAQELQREFGPLGERWKAEYGLPAVIALGIHMGEAVFGAAGPKGARQELVFGDSVSIAERMVHRARAGEIVLSLDFMKGLGAAVRTLGAHELPPLELGRRPAIPIYALTVDTRLDFT